MKNKHDIYWIHGLGEVGCPVESQSHCIHYDITDDVSWACLSDKIKLRLMALPINSHVVAYSLGGLLLLDQLIKTPFLQQHLGEIECRGVPMKGSFLASFSQSWMGEWLNFCFGISDISQRYPVLMASLSAFSKPCMSLCDQVAKLSNLNRITWYCGLGREAKELLCMGDGDGAVDGFMAHPETLFIGTEGRARSQNQFNIKFDPLADHRMIKSSHKTVRDVSGYQCWLLPYLKVKSIDFPKAWRHIPCDDFHFLNLNHQAYDMVFVPISVMKSDVHLEFRNGIISSFKQEKMELLACRPTLMIWQL